MSLLNPFGKKDAPSTPSGAKSEVQASGSSSQVQPPTPSKKEEAKKETAIEDVEDLNPDNKPKELPKEDEKGHTCQMKRGDYMIHVYIEQAKDLNIAPDEVADPIVEIKCLGMRKHTTAQEDISNTGIAVWNEHIFFEPKNQEVEDLEKAKLEIKLMDKGFFKDALIGYYEFDLSYLYQQKDHSLMHKWIVMSNPESENFGEITGLLKISVTIMGTGDEEVQITDDPHPEREDVIQPPQIKPKFYQLKFRFFCAQKIVPMDINITKKKNSSDAYVRMDYKSSKLKTKVLTIEDGGEIHWDQEFLVPAQIPIVGSRITFRIFDEDLVTDELIGSILYDLKDLIDQPDGSKGRFNGTFDWKNIYGSPLKCSGKNTDKMNLNPEIASFWKGRILMQVLCEESEKPLLLVQKIPADDVEQAKQYLIDRQFKIAIYFGSILSTPLDNTAYTLELRIADIEFNSEANQTKNLKYNRFNQRLTSDISKDYTFKLPYMSVQDIGTFFLYLKDSKGRRVCFYKGNIMDHVEANQKLKWIEMEPDLAIDKVTDHYKAGIVSFRFAIWDCQQGDIKWDDYPVWSSKLKKRPKNLKVRVFCWQARDLPAADESGSSDPFLRITDTANSLSTNVIWDNVNPLFYQGLDCIYEADTPADLPPIIVDLFDKDENVVGADSEDFLARACIQLQDVEKVSDGDNIPEPVWYPLHYKTGGPSSGEVLLSFAVVESDYTFKRSLKKLALEQEVEMQEFRVSMNILGLRGLQSPGLLPVKKAFLQFNLKSMVPPALGTNLNNVRTEPKMAGSDPTLNTLIEFDAPLPISSLYCPRLSCSVFDNIAMGFSQPLIGTFVIPIGDLMQSLAEERIRETEALQNVVEQVRKFASSETLVASFKNLIKVKQDEMNKNIAAELEAVRMKERIRQELASKLIHQTTNSSLNASQTNFDGAGDQLLTGDYQEEARQSDRIQEQIEAGIEGSNKRISDEKIYDIAAQIIQSRTNSISKRTGSVGSRGSKKSNEDGEIINRFDPKLKAQLLAQQAQNVSKARRDADEQRKKAEASYHGCSNVVMPKYKKDEVMDVDREDEVPPEEMFIGLGWDVDSTTGRKHYRRFYPDELENVKEILPIKTPFNQYDIRRGQTRGAKVSFWAQLTNNVKTDESGSASNVKIVGRFKAVVEVEDKDKKKSYLETKKDLIQKLINCLKQLAKNRKIENFDLDLEKLDSIEGRQELKEMMEPLQVNHLGIVQKLADIESDVILKRMLLKEEKSIVRIYMIEGFNLASRDMGGLSDPYLILKLGDKKFDERKNYILDEANPIFCKHYDFEAYFPGCPMLFIDAMDYDDLFGDDLIGSTSVDLEDRYFLPEWRALLNKPVEYRQLYHPSTSISQGQLKMWIEINPVKVKPEEQAIVYNITPKPPQQFEMRLSVFDTKEIVMMDDEGTSDVYIRAFFDSKKDALETDTHYRCQTGNASFNYRLKFKVQHPRKDYRLTVQAYDRDFFKSNDIIGSSTFDLKQAFDDCALTGRPLHVKKDYHDEYMKKEGDQPIEWDKEGESFWLPMMAKVIEGDKKAKPLVYKTVQQGFVRVRIDVTTIEHAEKNIIGSAREDPNTDPYLPPPIGRLHFSLNPCEMYRQMIGPAMRRKIAIWCAIFWCTVLCALILYYLVPIVIGNLLSSWIASWFKPKN